MAKHEKFILTELPKSSVVNSNQEDVDNGIETFINNAVQEHIKKIAQPPKPFEVDSLEVDSLGAEARSSRSPADLPAEGSAAEGGNAQTAAIENNHDEIKKTIDASSESHNINGQISDNEQSLSAASQEEGGEGVRPEEIQGANIDIEAIKAQEYQRGFAEAQAKHAEEKELAERQDASDNELAVLLQNRLSKIVPSADLDKKVAKLSSEAISGIAKKLHLVLPVNFQEIIF